MTVTSDATGAYQLVNSAVSRVERTLVFIKPDILLFLDRVDLNAVPAAVQARFSRFSTTTIADPARPKARDRLLDRPALCRAPLHARVAAGGRFHNRRWPTSTCPPSEGVFPFRRGSVPAPALAHAILTACTAAPSGDAHGKIALSQEGSVWRARGAHREQKIDVTFSGPARVRRTSAFSTDSGAEARRAPEEKLPGVYSRSDGVLPRSSEAKHRMPDADSV